jgi:hypothetical protein
MTFRIRAHIAHALRWLADRVERFHRNGVPAGHGWERNAAARRFVTENWHITDIDKLTDRAIRHGVYSAKNARSTVRWRIARIRGHLELKMRMGGIEYIVAGPAQSQIATPKSQIERSGKP